VLIVFVVAPVFHVYTELQAPVAFKVMGAQAEVSLPISIVKEL